MKIATQTVSIWENPIKGEFDALSIEHTILSTNTLNKITFMDKISYDASFIVPFSPADNYAYKYGTPKLFFLRDNLTL